jgi:DNA polymerase III epsilon subunit family exonuclease
VIWLSLFVISLALVALVVFVRSGRESQVHIKHLPEKFIVFDLETTGLDASRHEILEIGAIRVNRDSTEHDTFEALVRPTKKVPKKITELTGISQAMVEASGVPASEAVRDFVQFVGDLRLVTFNAKFDMAFLNQALMAEGIVLKNPVSCALKMARRAWPGRDSYRLSDFARDGNLQQDNTHRALGDCKRALIVYTAAASRLGAIS